VDLNCPKCNSENTQKITAIIDSGTTHSHGTSTSQAGTVSSSATHRSVLVRKLSAPSKYSRAYIIVKFLFKNFLSFPAAAFLADVFGKAGTDQYKILIMLSILGPTICLFFLQLKKELIIAKQHNENVYPQQIHTWKNGFFCHRCENVFVPR